jgi:hypothetical protein
LSALTKIAIVLLVVASLLLSAGVVVFVNKVEDFRAMHDAQKTSFEREQVATRNAKAEAEALRTQISTAATEFNRQLDEVRKESAAKDPIILEAKAAVAKSEQDKKVAEVALANVTAVQQGLQGQLAAAQTQITDMRKVVDRLVDERHTLNVQLTDALSKLETVQRAYQNAQEKLQAKTAMLDELENRVKGAGGLAAFPKRVSEGTPVVEGVVQGVFTAGGKQWASVSVGSKDLVEKGMKFNVVNNNEFLGYLTIQTTEPNEAAGVLEGPKVEKVRQGDQVKTNLQ